MEVRVIEALLAFFLWVMPFDLPKANESFVIDNATIMSQHDNGVVSLLAPAIDEPVVLGSFADMNDSTQGQGAAPTPVLTTSWTDAGGVNHSVVTPIPSTTEAGVKRSVELHEQLVKIMQTSHPPRQP